MRGNKRKQYRERVRNTDWIERENMETEMCERERITHTHTQREREVVNNTPGLVMIELSMVIFFPSPLSQQKNTISKLSLSLYHTHTHTHTYTHTHTPRNYNAKSQRILKGEVSLYH